MGVSTALKLSRNFNDYDLLSDFFLKTHKAGPAG